jgi:hypothetical protein
VCDLAAAWRVSPALVRKLIRVGSLPCYRLGQRVLISEPDAAGYLAGRRRQGQP